MSITKDKLDEIGARYKKAVADANRGGEKS